MSDDRNDLSVRMDDGRTVHLSSREAGCRIRHHAMPDNEIVAAFPLPSLPVGGDKLRRRAVILLSNGNPDRRNALTCRRSSQLEADI